MASPATVRASLDAPDRDGYRWPVQKEWDAIESAFSREHLRRLYPEAYAHPAYAARMKGVHDKLFQQYMRAEVRDCVRRLTWLRLGKREELFICEYTAKEREQIAAIIAPMSFDEIREAVKNG
jgi:hypothetical protein